MLPANDPKASQVVRDHKELLEKARSLDRCLDTICYYGEVCSDMRGFNELLRRCREIQTTLIQHIPEEEEVFEQLAGEEDLRPILDRLVAEHQAMRGILEESIGTLEALDRGDPLPQNLFTLQERLHRMCTVMQSHIATEDQYIFPRLAA